MSLSKMQERHYERTRTIHTILQWLQGNQIAAALGYKRSDAVTKIFDRNSDEFTDNMTAVTKLGVVRNQGGTIDLPNLGKQRIFSPRGASALENGGLRRGG